MDSKTFFSSGLNRALASVALICLILALGSYARYTYQQSTMGMYGPTTIDVRGEAEIQAKPDIGSFSFTVRAEGDDAAAAQAASAKSVNDILGYLASEEVADKDVKTQNYSLNEKFRYEERFCISGSFCGPGEQVADGYEVYQNVTVKVRNLENSGSLIAGVGERGATNISSIQFMIDDETVLKAEARAEAIADAQKKAQVLADNLGMRLGKIMSFYEDQGHYGYGGDMYYETRAMSMDSSESAPTPKMPVGENTIRSQVNIIYQLK